MWRSTMLQRSMFCALMIAGAASTARAQESTTRLAVDVLPGVIGIDNFEFTESQQK